MGDVLMQEVQPIAYVSRTPKQSKIIFANERELKAIVFVVQKWRPALHLRISCLKYLVSQ